MAPKYGYWNIQGLGQASRMVLAYTGTEYEDNAFDCTVRETWAEKKFSMGLDFPNLPYYIDDDVKLTQSNAILRYLGRKNGLYGSNDVEASTIDMLIDEAQDFKMALVKLAFNPDFEKVKAEHAKSIEPKFKTLNDFLGSKKFLMGDDVAIADFAFHDAIAWHQELDAELVGKFPAIVEYVARFKALDKMKAFFEGDRAYKSIFPPFAAWGYF